MSIIFIIFSGKLGFLSKLRVNKYVAGTFCTSKDLENLTQFLGVVMDDHDQKKVHYIYIVKLLAFGEVLAMAFSLLIHVYHLFRLNV
jgi:hypothetical protein